MIIDLSLPRFTWRKSADSQAMEASTEQALARRVAEADTDAIAEVYDRYGASLYRVLCALLGSTADAEDALQEVFARLAGGRGRPARELRAYLFTAARNEAYTILRRRQREQALADNAAHSLNVVELETAEFAHSTGATLAGADLLVLLQRLPNEQREVIALKVAENLTFAEIAVMLRISPNTAASRYRYGIERLRVWWQEENAT